MGIDLASAGTVEIPLERKGLDLLRPHVDPAGLGPMLGSQMRAMDLLAGRRVWSVNSAAIGGGVAEMSRTLLPYWRGLGIDARWVVIRAPDDFFRVTKRLHNRLHGHPGDGGPLGAAEFALLERVAATHARTLTAKVSAGDVVVLQDPQTACLVGPLKEADAIVVWRCHIGTERRHPIVEDAWERLLPAVAGADALVFTRPEFVPPQLLTDDVRIITPAIDPASVKNHLLAPGTAHAITRQIGLVVGRPTARTTVPCPDGSLVRVTRRAEVTGSGPIPRAGVDRVVLSLCRWDPLKDQAGIIRAFVDHVLPRVEAVHLIVAGPEVDAVQDDPGARETFERVGSLWAELAEPAQRRVHLAQLPMDSIDENAAMVNALQTQADVIVKKSLEEGFGLGVTEALWKQRPVVATGVGGHRDQIDDGRQGLLVDDPTDLEGFGRAVVRLLEDPDLAHRLAEAGRERVQQRFLADRHLTNWTRLFDELLVGRGAALDRTDAALYTPSR
jgi:trehalose synthase